MRHVGELNGVKVCITDHALCRLVEMGLSADDIKKLIFSPEEVYTSTKWPGSLYHRIGKHSLAMHKEGESLVVKTALYTTKKAWMDAHYEGKLAEDRKLRLDTNIPRF